MYTGKYGEARKLYPVANTMLNMVTSLPDREWAFIQFKTFSNDLYGDPYTPDDQYWDGFDPFILVCMDIQRKAADIYDISNPTFQEFQHLMRSWTPVTETKYGETTYEYENPSLWEDMKGWLTGIGIGIGTAAIIGLGVLVYLKKKGA